MTYYHRQYIFWALMLIMVVLHVDVWSWHRLHPLLWGWLPYEMWYRGLLTLVCTVLFWALARWMWPQPDEAALKRHSEEGGAEFDD